MLGERGERIIDVGQIQIRARLGFTAEEAAIKAL
jgi:hypothetical protein